MRKLVLSVLTVGLALHAAPLFAEEKEPRPSLSALRFDDASLMRAFTPEVSKSRRLRERALALWNHHFAAEAAAIERRFQTEADWRPAFADAARLVDEFLEASELPRAREWPAPDGEVWMETLDAAGEGRKRELVRGKVWMERTDPDTGVRTLELRAPFQRAFAPMGGSIDTGGPGKGLGATKVTLDPGIELKLRLDPLLRGWPALPRRWPPLLIAE